MSITVSVVLFILAAVAAGYAAWKSQSLGWLAVALLALAHLGL